MSLDLPQLLILPCDTLMGQCVRQGCMQGACWEGELAAQVQWDVPCAHACIDFISAISCTQAKSEAMSSSGHGLNDIIIKGPCRHLAMACSFACSAASFWLSLAKKALAFLQGAVRSSSSFSLTTQAVIIHSHHS